MASNLNLRTSGRKPGSRNRLQGNFCDALAKDFADHGDGVIRIVGCEKPVEYIKAVIAVLPKEFVSISKSSLDSMTDQELEDTLLAVRRARSEAAKIIDQVSDDT